MSDIDVFLSDQYVEFSKKIAEIHTKKKTMKEEFKAKFEEFNKQLKVLDDEARKAVAEWEAWKVKAENKEQK